MNGQRAKDPLDPLRFFPHDVHAHDNDKMDDLIADMGFGTYGRYWVLAELLGGWHGHMMDVSNGNRMRQAVFALRFSSQDELIEFIDELCARGLIDERSWRECKVVQMTRINKAANYSAQNSKNGKMGGAPAKAK